MKPTVRRLGLVDYADTFESMRNRIATRQRDDPDELWFLQHRPVYTLGQAGKREHLLKASNIPVIQTDRGGQVTYHGPGQLIAYVLFDLKRHKLGPKTLVNRLEAAVIALLKSYDITAERVQGAPGVYVDGAKIAALGLRIRNGYSYHGLALNVDMDLQPFAAINPCGYAGLTVTQMREQGVDADCEAVSRGLERSLMQAFDFGAVPAGEACGGERIVA